MNGCNTTPWYFFFFFPSNEPSKTCRPTNLVQLGELAAWQVPRYGLAEARQSAATTGADESRISRSLGFEKTCRDCAWISTGKGRRRGSTSRFDVEPPVDWAAFVPRPPAGPGTGGEGILDRSRRALFFFFFKALRAFGGGAGAFATRSCVEVSPLTDTSDHHRRCRGARGVRVLGSRVAHWQKLGAHKTLIDQPVSY